ncbi:hypothetical protein EV191_10616 [Tamaricihabitans halophyticus]|uniref:Uncharacterized protein n=2 Tax=Tamaricihabitans halophyticus TaxID=1262583 RepID=A0A4R2QQ47_9PSEU|nr:hypothetical protein EV191_10616 [Tamaricihabitans halophyticus]
MLEDRQGEVVLIDSWFGDPLVTLHGPQRAALGRYFRALHCDAGSALAEVLWLIGQGGGDQRVRRQALELFRAMGLAEPAPPAK